MSLKKTIMTDDYSPFGEHYKRGQKISVMLYVVSFAILIILVGEIGLYSSLIYIIPITFSIWLIYDSRRGFAQYLQERYG